MSNTTIHLDTMLSTASKVKFLLHSCMHFHNKAGEMQAISKKHAPTSFVPESRIRAGHFHVQLASPFVPCSFCVSGIPASWPKDMEYKALTIELLLSYAQAKVSPYSSTQTDDNVSFRADIIYLNAIISAQKQQQGKYFVHDIIYSNHHDNAVRGHNADLTKLFKHRKCDKRDDEDKIIPLEQWILKKERLADLDCGKGEGLFVGCCLNAELAKASFLIPKRTVARKTAPAKKPVAALEITPASKFIPIRSKSTKQPREEVEQGGFSGPISTPAPRAVLARSFSVRRPLPGDDLKFSKSKKPRTMPVIPAEVVVPVEIIDLTED